MEQPPKKKYLDTVREILRRRHYARSTKDSYVIPHVFNRGGLAARRGQLP